MGPDLAIGGDLGRSEERPSQRHLRRRLASPRLRCAARLDSRSRVAAPVGIPGLVSFQDAPGFALVGPTGKRRVEGWVLAAPAAIGFIVWRVGRELCGTT
jgi:hypothetical protein